MTTATGSGAGETGFPANAVEEALAQAIQEAETQEAGDAAPGAGEDTAARFLTALREGDLWVPLPVGSGTQEDGSIALPTLEVEGSHFVPAFTSEEQLGARSSELPYTVVPARDLASVLPGGVGLALNPGNEPSVPVYPEMVRVLRADEGEQAGGGPG